MTKVREPGGRVPEMPARGRPAAAPAAWAPSRRERLRYAFDNFMARGTAALVAGLFVASALLILVVGLAVALTGVGEDRDLGRLLWMNLLRTLDPGTMGGDEGSPLFLGAMLLVTLGGIFVISTLIGILSTGIESKLGELRKGRSRVLEQGHIVVLGWSQEVFAVVGELVAANANQPNACIVVLGAADKVEMEDALRTRVGPTGRVRVVCRSGSPIDLDDIDIASVQTSRAIIVLAPETDDPDSDVIKTILALTNDANRRPEPYHIVGEIRDAANLDVARMVGGDEVELVLAGELVARVVAQTCRQAGLSVVYGELLDFAGDEIYFVEAGPLAGRTVGDALFAFESSTVLGIRPRGGAPLLLPPLDTPVRDGDRLIVLTEDDDTARATERAVVVDEAAIVAAEPRSSTPERTLVFGWSWLAPRIVKELDGYVSAESEVHVVTLATEAAGEVERLDAASRNLRVRLTVAPTTDRATLDALEIPRYDHVIVLSDASLDPQRADARTLVTLLHLRDIAASSGHPFSIVSEMVDLRNRALAEVTRADDFIVSDRLVSLLMSQIAENRELATVFRDLFDPEGAEIYLRPAASYVRLGVPLTFDTLIEAARRRGELALGYRSRSAAGEPGAARALDGGVVLNPRRSRTFTLGEGDRVIVLGRS